MRPKTMFRTPVIVAASLLSVGCVPVVQSYYAPSGPGETLYAPCSGPREKLRVSATDGRELYVSLVSGEETHATLKMWIDNTAITNLKWDDAEILIRDNNTGAERRMRGIKARKPTKRCCDYTKKRLHEIDIESLESKDFDLSILNVMDDDKPVGIPKMHFKRETGFFIYGLCQ